MSAYYVLWIKGMRLVFLPADLLFGLVEKLLLRKAPPNEHPVVFVVGIHRTGSTFVSQVLADNFGFAPLGNYATLFPRSRYIVHRFLRAFYHPGKRRSKKYRSYYGISRGFYSIGDCYEVWDQWMGKDHYNHPGAILSARKEDMKNYLDWMQHSWGRPVITKNNRNALVLKTLYETVPGAFFVMVHRKPAEVIQSTMQAGRDFFGTDEIIWGLRASRDFSRDDYGDKLDAYCRQYLDLEVMLNEALKQLDPGDYYALSYEDFCERPLKIQEEIWDKLTSKYKALPGRPDFGRSKYYPSHRLFDEQLSGEISRRLEKIRNEQGANGVSTK